MKPKHLSISKLEKQIKGRFSPRVPKSRKEEAELGKGKIDVLICKKCKAVYWYKSWHHSLDQKLKLDSEKLRLKFVLCPACQMIRDKKFEGEVLISNIPFNYKKEILKLIKNIKKRAYQRDPMDRIISIREIRGKFVKISGFRVLTTENQLAVSIGKQIKRAFKEVKLDIQWSHKESTARVRVKF